MMAVGAIGVVSVISHLAGPQVAAMVKAAASGDVDRARDLHQRLLPLGLACFLDPNPSPVKAALNALWEPVGLPRLPLVPSSEQTVAAIKDALTQL
jgi:4-hydroxy-tetrahydrodipicolinate synthase